MLSPGPSGLDPMPAEPNDTCPHPEGPYTLVPSHPPKTNSPEGSSGASSHIGPGTETCSGWGGGGGNKDRGTKSGRRAGAKVGVRGEGGEVSSPSSLACAALTDLGEGDDGGRSSILTDRHPTDRSHGRNGSRERVRLNA